MRAKILATTGRLEDGEADARRAVSLAERTDWSNDHAAACVALGEVLKRRGRPEEAKAAIEMALALYEAKESIVAAEGVRALVAGLVPA